MSLEAIMQENTAALNSHTAVLQALLERLGAGAVLPTPSAETPAVIAKADAAKPAAEQPKEEAKETKTDTTVTYDQIKPLIIKLNTTKGREAAAGLLAEFGVTRGPELKPEQFADFFTKVTAALA